MSRDKVYGPRIVVLGAGFGGLTFCQRFRGPGRITLIDKTNHHLFQPLLYQVAMAGLAAPDIAAPIRSVLRRKRHVTVLMDTVTRIDLQQRRVVTERREVEYDYLVIALGGRTSYFGHDAWEAIAPGLKTLDDAMRMRRQVIGSFERAESTDDEAERRRLMTIAVVGGGPTGVELAGAMAELAKRVFRRDFRRIDPTQARVLLIEAGDRVLGGYPPDLCEKAKVQLEQLGVEVRLNAPVTRLEPDRVELGTGEVIESHNMLWGAGVQACDVVAAMQVEHAGGGRINVERDLSVPGHREVFAIGDNAQVLQKDGSPVPGVAPAAMQMGKHVAKLISHEVRHGRMDDGQRPTFRYWDKGTMATIGRRRAVARVGRFKFTGLLAWLAWLAIHLIFLVGFRNKVAVLFDWGYSYFTYGRGARIIYDLDRDE